MFTLEPLRRTLTEALKSCSLEKHPRSRVGGEGAAQGGTAAGQPRTPKTRNFTGPLTPAQGWLSVATWPPENCGPCPCVRSLERFVSPCRFSSSLFFPLKRNTDEGWVVSVLKPNQPSVPQALLCSTSLNLPQPPCSRPPLHQTAPNTGSRSCQRFCPSKERPPVYSL